MVASRCDMLATAATCEGLLLSSCVVLAGFGTVSSFRSPVGFFLSSPLVHFIDILFLDIDLNINFPTGLYLYLELLNVPFGCVYNQLAVAFRKMMRPLKRLVYGIILN